MPPGVQVGSILIEEKPPIAPVLGLESESYSGTWGVVKALNAVTLDRKIHAAGRNFLFMAAEVKVSFLGALGAEKIQNALRRILAKVRNQNFNSLEVTGIVARRFLGVPYATISAHSRHIQQSCHLDGAEERRASRDHPENGRRRCNPI